MSLTTIYDVLFCVLQMSQVRCFLGISVQRAAKFPCEDFRQRVQSATICFKQMVFTWEESTLLTYAWAWKTHLLSNQRTGEVSHFLTVVDPWTMILLPVLCETITCHRSTGVCESFFEELRLLWKRKKRLPYWQPHRCKLWPKMAQELNPHGGWKERSRHNNTKKKSNGTLLIQLQHSPYSFFLNPLLSGCKLFWVFFLPF